MKEYFSSSRGLWQGDPLSPSLFIFNEDVIYWALLARSLKKCTFSTTNAIRPSHLFFADDIILFSNAKQRTVLLFMSTLKQNQNTSVHLFNWSTCKSYAARKTPTPRVNLVHAVACFRCGTFPFTYLGAPYWPGQAVQPEFPAFAWQSCFENSRMVKILSDNGRLIFIWHVLTSMPIHLLMATSLPELLLQKLESILSNFFWGSSEYGKKRHWIWWSHLCLLVDEEGLGIKNLRDIFMAMNLKK